MDEKQIAAELQSLAASILAKDHGIVIECDGCGYGFIVNRSEAKRLQSVKKGIYCKHCRSFMQRSNPNSIYYNGR